MIRALCPFPLNVAQPLPIGHPQQQDEAIGDDGHHKPNRDEVLTAAAIPLGWLLGYGFGLILIQSFSSDLYRVPFVIDRSTYAVAALVVIGAAAISALIVRRRVDRLDLVSVLKTRD
jgi:hypothetical protein